MASKFDFSKSSFVVITGASQGIGQTIAVEICRALTEDSKILLIARSANGLAETRNMIEDVNSSVNICEVVTDLSNLITSEFDNLFDLELQRNFDQAIIIHNAGQIGELNKTTELNKMRIWNEYYKLNLFSVSILNASFLKNIEKITKNIHVINITSLCGRSPFKNLALYGSAKAARDLFFKVLAEEESHVTVLNYSPGPVKTAMYENIIENVKDEDIKNMFMNLDNVLTCEQTVGKLMAILIKGTFKSGDTIDYFDEI